MTEEIKGINVADQTFTVVGEPKYFTEYVTYLASDYPGTMLDLMGDITIPSLFGTLFEMMVLGNDEIEVVEIASTIDPAYKLEVVELKYVNTIENGIWFGKGSFGGFACISDLNSYIPLMNNLGIPITEVKFIQLATVLVGPELSQFLILKYNDKWYLANGL